MGAVAIALRGDRGLKQLGLFIIAVKHHVAIALRGDRGLKQYYQP